jgi:hypothetical protein
LSLENSISLPFKRKEGSNQTTCNFECTGQLLLVGAFQSGTMDILVGNVCTMAGALLIFIAIKEK